ncbi:MAG: hypothetical protein WEC75_01980 [Dehalococcoidia bacterium]
MEQRETAAGEAAAREGVRASDYVRFDPRIFEAALPALVFIAVNRVGPVEAAIGASFAAALVVFLRNPGRGAIRALSAFSFALVTVSAIIGIALGSGKAFVAQNIFVDFAFAVIFAGSIVVKRPFVGLIARDMAPAIRPALPVGHRVFVRLTVASIALNLAVGGARIFLIRELSEDAYVILSRVLFIPLNVAFYALCYWAIARTAIREWPEDVPPPPKLGEGPSGGSAVG